MYHSDVNDKEEDKKIEKDEYRFIIDISNKYLHKWNFFTCILVLYDCYMVPYKNSFGSKIFSSNIEMFLMIVDNTIKFAFGIDVIIGFRKAYFNDATL